MRSEVPDLLTVSKQAIRGYQVGNDGFRIVDQTTDATSLSAPRNEDVSNVLGKTKCSL